MPEEKTEIAEKHTVAHLAPALLAAVLIAGGVGGMLPTLAKEASNQVAARVGEMPSAPFFFGLAIWFVVGGAVVFMMKETDARKAMALGVAAPGIITSMLTGAALAGKPAADIHAGSPPTVAAEYSRLLGIESAHADPVTGIRLAQAMRVSGRQLNVVPAIKGDNGVSALDPVTVEFLSKEQKVLSSSTIDARSKITLDVPAGSYTVRATSQGYNDDKKLPEFDTADLNLKIDLKRSKGLLWALGGVPALKVDGVDVGVANVWRVPAMVAAYVPAAGPGVEPGTGIYRVDGEKLGTVQTVEDIGGGRSKIVVREKSIDAATKAR